ncbi:MAG: hypothetical protein Q4E13_11330, partial [Clostridia bacterium]|nr:hypothetical protein [Clostridia bacterium]
QRDWIHRKYGHMKPSALPSWDQMVFRNTYDLEQGLSITALSDSCDDVWSARRALEAECEGMDNGTGFIGNTAI